MGSFCGRCATGYNGETLDCVIQPILSTKAARKGQSPSDENQTPQQPLLRRE